MGIIYKEALFCFFGNEEEAVLLARIKKKIFLSVVIGIGLKMYKESYILY
jgi:hypothetical protein